MDGYVEVKQLEAWLYWFGLARLGGFMTYGLSSHEYVFGGLVVCLIIIRYN